MFRVISLKVTDYFCKGTPTKVVMLFLRIVAGMYSAAAIAYPFIRAGVNISGEKNKIGFVSPARRYEAPVSCTAAANVI